MLNLTEIEKSDAVSASANGAIQFWSGDTIERMCRTPLLASFFERWTKLNLTGLPRLRTMIEGAPDAVSTHLQIIHRVPHDFVLLHEGAAAMRILSREAPGVLYSEIGTQVAKETSWLFESILDHRQPIYFRYVMQGKGEPKYVEKIAVPVAAEASHAPEYILTLVHQMDDRNDILRAIFEHSNSGLIAALPIGQGEGKPPDGPVVMINRRARQLMKLPPSLDKLKTIRDLGPWLRDGAMWTRVNTQTRGGRSEILYEDRNTRQAFIVGVEQVDRFMLISVDDVTGTPRARLAAVSSAAQLDA